MTNTLLTFPASTQDPLSIRAKALLFHDPASIRLLRHIERVAPTEATVLIVGETGTGKELVARHLHALSGIKGPFIAVNCGAFSENLIDAELFGHEAGAFTGASQSRAGWFEAANGGTLFLDEIGDLPLHLQVKLLRVLQEQQVVRLGSRKPISLQVRLIAATNVALERAVHAKKFRADLYYRLHVAALNVLPLRSRKDDILPLAQHFIKTYCGRLGFGRIILSKEAEAALLEYSWPGNIRELENIIHYALIVSRHGVIQMEDLGFAGHQEVVAPSAEDNSVDSDVIVLTADAPQSAVMRTSEAREDPIHEQPGEASAIALNQLSDVFSVLLTQEQDHLYESVEQLLVLAAYKHCNNNQVRTAKKLGVSRNTLRTLLRRYDLLEGM